MASRQHPHHSLTTTPAAIFTPRVSENSPDRWDRYYINGIQQKGAFKNRSRPIFYPVFDRRFALTGPVKTTLSITPRHENRLCRLPWPIAGGFFVAAAGENLRGTVRGTRHHSHRHFNAVSNVYFFNCIQPKLTCRRGKLDRPCRFFFVVAAPPSAVKRAHEPIDPPALMLFTHSPIKRHCDP